MGDVIRLGKKEFPEGTPGTDPHLAGEAKCLACGHEWAAVAPVPLVDLLECPGCNCVRGVMKYPVLRDMPNNPLWTCPCGCDLFRVTPQGFYCPSCGDWQRFPK